MGNGRTEACSPDFFRVSISLKVSGCTNSPPSTIRSFVAPVSSRVLYHVMYSSKHIKLTQLFESPRRHNYESFVRLNLISQPKGLSNKTLLPKAPKFAQIYGFISRRRVDTNRAHFIRGQPEKDMINWLNQMRRLYCLVSVLSGCVITCFGMVHRRWRKASGYYFGKLLIGNSRYMTNRMDKWAPREGFYILSQFKQGATTQESSEGKKFVAHNRVSLK